MTLLPNFNLYSLISAILIFFFIMIFFYGRNRHKVNSATLVISIYLFSIVGSWFLEPSIVPSIESYSLFASLLFVFSLLLLCLPIVLARLENVEIFDCVNESLFFILAKMLIVFNIIVYIYFIPQVINLFFSDESIMVLRSQVVGGTNEYAGQVPYFISFISQFYPVAITVYFYSYIKFPEKSRFNRILLWSSTGYIINVIASIGRDGVVLWSLSFFFSYLLFLPFIDHARRKRIKNNIFILMGLILSLFMVLSVGRFYRDGNIYMFFQYLLMYFSQQFGEFNQYVNKVHLENFVWSDIFPLLKIIPGNSLNEMSLLDDHYQFLANHNFSKYVFKSFIGSFYVSVGSWGLILITSIFSFVFSLLFGFRDKRYISLGMIILYTLYCQVILHGVFYYKLSYGVSHLYILSCICLFVIFNFRITLGGR
ncbi:O-antigen polymerase [Vibrio toranzoniae]|uniref:O-antigen polymerase n=1 Tax=Vibrio toranzoniae TaxID=1194427 RepID=UPI001376C624|nr:O-antigen polymerase [Vibrio toranzoniae]NAZ95991.1 hypothetical protein [Vibrio toranzoniae]